MAVRNLLAKHKLPEFKQWLIDNGVNVKEPVGDFEVLRWQGKPGFAMPIIFDRHSATEHYTCNGTAAIYVRRWIRDCSL